MKANDLAMPAGPSQARMVLSNSAGYASRTVLATRSTSCLRDRSKSPTRDLAAQMKTLMAGPLGPEGCHNCRPGLLRHVPGEAKQRQRRCVTQLSAVRGVWQRRVVPRLVVPSRSRPTTRTDRQTDRQTQTHSSSNSSNTEARHTGHADKKERNNLPVSGVSAARSTLK